MQFYSQHLLTLSLSLHWINSILYKRRNSPSNLKNPTGESSTRISCAWFEQGKHQSMEYQEVQAATMRMNHQRIIKSKKTQITFYVNSVIEDSASWLPKDIFQSARKASDAENWEMGLYETIVAKRMRGKGDWRLSLLHWRSLSQTWKSEMSIKV